MTVSDWFFLNPHRNNFMPSVTRDRNLFLCHLDIQKQIQEIIERSFALKIPVKMILYGDWGVGKTHTIHHLAWWMEQNAALYPTKTYLVEVGDVTKKSRFDILIRRFLDQIGIREIIRLVHEYRQKTGVQVAKGLAECGVPKPICDVFNSFLMVAPGDTPPEAVQQAFNFLKAQDVKGSLSLGMTGTLSESEDFYGVLVSLGELYKKVDEKQLILIADEAAKLEAVEGDDPTNSHWLSTNRMIFDDQNVHFGFIYTISSKGRKGIPPFLVDAQIENRLGKDNYIELNPLAPADVTSFLQRLFADFLDWNRISEAVSSGTIPSGVYDQSSYPFEPSAKAAFVDYFNRTQQDSKPRDICKKLDAAAFIAFKGDKRVIDMDSLDKAGL
ncbi:hypothetical protein [Mesorhizobium sp. M0802]|uniref:hypothetical protein n=1 Tax=Mesorhizobium sp. M0802 TaxID=2957001 RepID=UPI003336EF6F